MAKARLATLISELHLEFLKPAGFRKEGNTFSRERCEYVERFNFQGSSWSSASETLFYLNVGVEFSEFGPAEQGWMFFKRTHWANRIDELVREAPDDWRCNDSSDRTTLKRQLAHLISGASEQIGLRIAELRSSYLARMARIEH